MTLADRMEYDEKSINANFGQLLMSLVIMSRAHEESATKALRSQAAWDQKRRQAGNGHKLTAKAPAWLKLSDDRKSFEVLPEVAQAVNKIFQMKLEGKGSEGIVRTLNADPGTWKPNGKRNPNGGWHKSYIDKILRSRAVIGEYQPHKNAGGKRTPEGDPIADYFPAIVEKEIFDRVQAAMMHNHKTSPGNGGGRNGPVNNLFGHIAKCFYCGGPMAYICKHKSRKDGSYLVCDTARRGLGCKKNYTRYDQFEPLILSYCKGLDPEDILPGNEKMQSELALLRNQLQAVEGDIAQVEVNINHLLDNLEIGEIVKDRLEVRQEEKAMLEVQREALRSQIAETTSLAQDAEKQLSNIKELIEHMGKLEGQERIDLRLNLRNLLRRLITQINCLPDKGQVGMLFKTGERRLLILEGDKVQLLDIQPKAYKCPAQLWSNPWKMQLNRS